MLVSMLAWCRIKICFCNFDTMNIKLKLKKLMKIQLTTHQATRWRRLFNQKTLVSFLNKAKAK